jgi:hypothetical protein
MNFAIRQQILSAAITLVMLASGSAHALSYSRVDLADGFDFPVGKPDGGGYYTARGFTPNGHLGEDWNGRGGGDSDLGDPIYSTANGIVVVSENIGIGWGNCIIVRHAYRDTSGRISMVDSQYGHLLRRLVSVGQQVKRGDVIGTMGGNNGMYPVHLHFEMRKNLQIGMNRSQFARDYSNYYSPTHFINLHRTCPVDLARVEVPTDNFAAYGKSLSTVDTKPYLRRGYSIPVYRAPSSGNSSRTPPPSMPSLPPPATPAVNEPPSVSPSRSKPSVPRYSSSSKPKSTPPQKVKQADTGGFWARLKARFKSKKSSSTETPTRNGES